MAEHSLQNPRSDEKAATTAQRASQHIAGKVFSIMTTTTPKKSPNEFTVLLQLLLSIHS